MPRVRLELCQSLSRSFGDGAKVILDRRLEDRRARADGHGPERRRGERRRGSDMDAELRAGRWVVRPGAPGRVDLIGPDARAILFLCCAEHVVPCQRCQSTYRLRWIPRVNGNGFPCPRCGEDLTPSVAGHAQSCGYWAAHGGGTGALRLTG